MSGGNEVSSPNANVWRENSPGKRTSVAATSIDKFYYFSKQKLLSVSLGVVVAGTDTAAGIDIYIGTTSVAAITTGTATALSTFSVAVGVDIPANGYIELKGKANSSTLQFAPCFESIPYHDSAPTSR